MICGVFGHPNGFWQRGFRLGDLGINAVFVSSGDIDQQTIDRTRAEGGQIFAEFATLNGDYGDYVANHPEAHPIDESGQPAARATWFMGAFPSLPGPLKRNLKWFRQTRNSWKDGERERM